MVTLEQLKTDAKRMAQTSQKNTIEAVTLEQLKEEARAIRQTMPTQTEPKTVANPEWYEEYQAMKAAEANRQAYLDTIKNNMYSPMLIQPQSWLEEKQAEQEALQKEIATNNMYSPTLIQPEGWREQRQAQAEENQSRIAAIQAMLPGEAVAGNADRVAELEAELSQLQQAQTRNEYSAGPALNTLTGAAKQYGAGFVNLLGDIAQLGGASEREEELTRLNAQIQNPDLTAAERAQIQSRINILNANPGTDNEVRQPQYYEAADRLAAAGALDIEQAKQGQGKLGQTLIDVGSGAAQLGADIAAGALTGGSILLPMAIRSYGGASQEARQNGASYGESVLTGLASAALSALTEKVSGVGVERLTGVTGGLDGIINKGINMAVERFGKTAGGKAALDAVLSALGAGVGEGLEEGAEALLQPLVQRIYDEQALEQYATAEFWADAAYDALVGGLVGAVAGGAEQVGYFGKSREAYDAQQKAAPETEAARTRSGNVRLSDADYDEYLNTGAKLHTRNKKSRLAESGVSPIMTTFGEIKDFLSKIIHGEAGGQVRAYAKVGEGLASAIQEVGGIDVRGKYLEIVADDIRESYKVHHTAKESGDIDLSDADFLNATKYLDDFDHVLSVDKFKGKQKITLSKAIDGGHVIILEVVSSDRNALQLFKIYGISDEKFDEKYGNRIKNRSTGSRGATTGKPASPNASTRPPLTAGAPVSGPTISQNAPIVKSGETSNDGTLPEGTGAASSGFGSDFNRLQMQTDRFIPEGENPARVVDVPAQDADGRNISRTARTVMEAKQTPDSRIPTIEDAAVQGELSYDSVTNEELAADAEAAVESRGWAQALADWRRAVYSGRVSDELVAMGAVLLNNAGNSDMSGAEYVDLLVDYSTLLNKAGKAVQAARLLKRLTPEGRLYGIQKSIERLVEEYGGKYEFTLDEALVEKYRAADNDKARNAVIEEIQQSIADQVPSTLLDKWTALRYVNMLGNFKTQVRNVLGNTIMGATTRLKNKVAAAIELGVYAASGGKFERTKALTVSKELRKAARADFSNVEKIALGEAKYREGSLDADLQGIEEKRTIFKNNGAWGTAEDSSTIAKAARKVTDFGWRTLEAYRNATNWAMEKGDVIFSREAYTSALAGWMKTHNITAEQWNSGEVDSDTMDKARAYAIKEAQEATFRDNNAFSDWVSKIGRRKDTPKAAKAVSEGVTPFRKTPANVLVRAEEYSPLGIINTAVTAAKAAKGTEEITGNDVINSAAKALTGTGIFALGYLLRSLGRLHGSSDEPDDNIQDYSLVLPDGSNYTIDWMSPVSMPLFMGVQLFDMLQDDGFQWADIEGVLSSIADPMIQMSMLSGVNDTLDSIKYSDNNLIQTVVSGALSYLTQGLTNTFVGQIESAAEKYRQTTTVDKDSDIPAYIQRAIGKASAKIPGMDYAQADYIDVWGRREENPTGAANIFETFLSPGYVNRSDSDPVVQETNRLYEAGFTSAKPTKPSQSFTYSENGQKVTVNLNAQEYQEYQEQIGTTRYDLVNALLGTEAFAALSDEQKEGVLSKIYSYAEATAKASISGYQPENWMLAVAELSVEDAVQYLALDEVYDDVTDAVKNGTEADFDLIDQLTSYWLGNESREAMADVWDGALDNLISAAAAGIDAEQWLQFAQTRSDTSSIKDAEGNTVTSKQDQLISYIDSLPVSVEEKDWLYLVQYTDARLAECPWNVR